MGISEFCIRRPVFTLLLMAALMVAGIAGYKQLPVSALPSVDFPTISVSAMLPGASAESMAASVATPLEREFSTIAGVSSITSSSMLGYSQITMQFDLGRDIDGAALDVQTAISNASRKLPKEMLVLPYFKKANPADQPVLFIAVSSKSMPITTVNDYADTFLAQRLSSLPGVAQVSIFGEQKYAVRVQADPNKLAAQKVTMGELQAAISAATSTTPAGTISGSKQLFTLNVHGQPKDAGGFRPLVAAWRNGAPVRLGDVATVADSVEDDRSMGFIDGNQSIVIAVQRQPDANTIDVVKRVRELMPAIQAQIPAAIEMTPLFDRSLSIQASVADVQFTLLLTIGLVVGVIYLFLGNVRATLIPALAVPLSIVCTYGAMALLGYSINNISLLALTLCVGFVVDDAIVMLENIMRHIEAGMRPFEAAIKGAREIGFTIISMTLSLIAVFIPVLFMGGIVGRLFQEFAVTISIAILASGLIALTLSPMLCARWLRPITTANNAQHGSALFQKLLHRYDTSLQWVLAHPRWMLGATLLSIVLSVVGFALVPKGFFPTEDTGFVLVSTEAAQDISYASMKEKHIALEKIVRAEPAIDHVFHAVGGARESINNGRMFLSLKPHNQRDGLETVLQRLRKASASVVGIKPYFQPIQNIQIGGRRSKSQYQYTLQTSNLEQLFSWAEKLMARLQREALLTDVTSDMQMKSQQIGITLDQAKAASMGIRQSDVQAALYAAYGGSQVGTIYTSTDDYGVILEVTPQFRDQTDAIGQLFISGTQGQPVPLSSIARITHDVGPMMINHQGQMPSVTLSFNMAPGTSLSQATDLITRTKAAIGMPDTISGSFQGAAQAFQASANGQGMLLLLAIVVIYIILGMLYESFVHPITILSGLPSAGLGALGALALFGMDLDVIALIGLILLVGIVKKNAIMMVDFAQAAQAEGHTPYDAIYQACIQRFRPIMMTTMAAIFGTLPIAIGVGTGGELRQPLGIAVVGGLLTSQLLTLYITPVIYLALSRLSARVRGIQ